jgi:hypothetical protein
VGTEESTVKVKNGHFDPRVGVLEICRSRHGDWILGLVGIQVVCALNRPIIVGSKDRPPAETRQPSKELVRFQISERPFDEALQDISALADFDKLGNLCQLGGGRCNREIAARSRQVRFCAELLS